MVMPTNFNRLLLGAMAGGFQPPEAGTPPAKDGGIIPGVTQPVGPSSLPMGLQSVLPPFNVFSPQIPLAPQIPASPLLPPAPIPPRIPPPPSGIPSPPQDLDIPRYQGPQTWTILARSALALLEQASRENLDLALNTIVNNNIPGDRLLFELEHGSFSYDQVVRELARGWPEVDVNGFANRFGMPREQLDVMDLIVSLALLNDPALEGKLRGENQIPSTPRDFLSSRRVVWQSVEPGSVLNPPYVILIAVEAVDTAAPNDVVQSILGQLTAYRRGDRGEYKLPQAAVARLSGSPAAVARTAFLNPQVLSLLASRVPVAVAPRPENESVRPSGSGGALDRFNASG